MTLLNSPFGNALFENVDRILSTLSSQRQSPARVNETDEAYTLSLDLPGVPKDSISTTIEKDLLTLAVEIDEESETFVSSQTHRWNVPKNVDASAISAALENGVLILTLPKAQIEDSTHNITIS